MSYKRALARLKAIQENSRQKDSDNNISPELKKLWAEENAKIELETGKTPKNKPTPEKLRKYWAKEDKEQKLRE